MSTLASLLVKIGADVSGLVNGTQTGVAAVNKLSGDVQAAGKQMMGTGRRLTYGVTLPVIGLGVKAISAASDFEKSMNTMAAVAGVPQKQVSELGDLALEMGAKTVFSAQEAADAMVELSKGGLSVAQIKAGSLANTLDLAAAADMGLAESAVIVSQAMNTFGLSGKNSTEIVDALAGAANQSSADVGDLSLALSQGGAAASRFGLSVQETAGMLALLADRGIRGSDAGTLLKSQLRTLVPITDRAREKMKELGLDFFDAEGRFIGVARMAAELKREMGGLSQEQRELAINQLFGSDASRLAGILAKEGATGLREYTKAATEAGAASEVANARMKGLPGALEQLRGSIETAFITFGTAIAPFIKTVANFVTDLVNKFGALDPRLQRFIALALGIAAVVGPLIFILGLLVTGIGAVMSPVVLVIAAIGLLAIAFIKLWNESETVRNLLTGAWQAIQKAAQEIWPKVKEVIVVAIEMVRAVIQKFVGIATEIWNRFGKHIIEYAKNAWNNLKQFISGILNVIKGVIQVVTGIIKGDWEKVWEGIKNIVSGVWNMILAVIKNVINNVKAIIGIGLAVISGLWSAAWNGIKHIFSLAWEAIVSSVKQGIGKTIDFFKALPGRIVSALGDLGELLIEAGKDIIRGLIKGIGSMVGKAVDAVKNVVGGVIDGAKGLLGIGSPSKVFYKIGQDTVAGLAGGLRETKAVNKSLEHMVDQIEKHLKGKVRRAFMHEVSALSREVDRAESHLERLQNRSEEVASRIQSGFDNIQGDVISDLANMDLGIYEKVADAEGNITDVLVGQKNATAEITKMLEDRAEKAMVFADLLNTLESRGVSRSMLMDIAESGDIAFAQAMARATDEQISSINSSLSQIDKFREGITQKFQTSFFGEEIENAAKNLADLTKQAAELGRQIQKAVELAVEAEKAKKAADKAAEAASAAEGKAAKSAADAALAAAKAAVSAANAAAAKAMPDTDSKQGGGAKFTSAISGVSEAKSTTVSYNFGDVKIEIPVKDLEEMKTVDDFFKYIKQAARSGAGKGVG